jgi:hypothetical protein
LADEIEKSSKVRIIRVFSDLKFVPGMTGELFIQIQERTPAASCGFLSNEANQRHRPAPAAEGR